MTLCACEKEFDFKNAVQLTNNNYDQLKMDSINRLTDIVGKRCLYCKNMCRKTAISVKEVQQSSDAYYVIKVDPYFIDEVKIQDLHLLCKKCRDILKKQYEEVDEDQKKVKYVELNCFLCDMTHQIDNKYMKSILSDRCSCNCIVF